MTKKRSILTSLTILTIAISIVAFKPLNCCDDCKAEIKNRYRYNKISSFESYIDDCFLESKKGIQFPLEKPAFTKLHFDKLNKPYQTLDTNQTEIILKVLNDSASYIWGEIGNPHFDRCFTFYDKDGNCIGCMDFSFDGQTYSIPNLAKMKWGMLSDTARAILMTIINSDKE